MQDVWATHIGLCQLGTVSLVLYAVDKGLCGWNVLRSVVIDCATYVRTCSRSVRPIIILSHTYMYVCILLVSTLCVQRLYDGHLYMSLPLKVLLLASSHLLGNKFCSFYCVRLLICAWLICNYFITFWNLLRYWLLNYYLNLSVIIFPSRFKFTKID